MKGRLSTTALGCVMACLLAGAAYAQPRIQPPSGQPQQQPQPQPQPQQGGLIDGTTAELTAQMMTAAGYTDVKVVTHNNQNHVVGKSGDTPVVALHVFCKDGTCKLISFFVNFGQQQSIGNDYISAWNDGNTLARLRRNKQGNLIFDMDVIVFGGVTSQYITVASAVFALRLKELLQFKPS